MSSLFILLLLFVTPAGELIIGQDDEIFPTAEACQARASQRVEEAGKQVLWISTSCAEVPKNPGGKKSGGAQ